MATDWNGCHGSIFLGAGRASSQSTDLPYQDGPYAVHGVGWNSAYESVKSHGSGAAAGLSLGCDREIGEVGAGKLILGGAIDHQWMNAKGQKRFSGSGADTKSSFDLESASALRARLGYAQGNMLLYVTGGVARGKLDVRTKDETPPATMDVARSGSKTGWVAGIGAAWALTETHMLDVSLLHYDFGKVTTTGSATDPIEAYPRFDHEISANVLRIGMNWRF